MKLKNKIIALCLTLVLVCGNINSIFAETPAKNIVPAPKVDDTISVEIFNEDGSIETAEVPVDYNYQVEDNSVSQIADGTASPAPYNFKSVDLINNGDDSKNYCILICGDGYTAGEQDKFIEQARNVANYFMVRSPLSESDIKSKINIRAVCTVSNVSGVQEAEGHQEDPLDTFFKATFWNGGIERLVCIHDENRLREIKEQYMPECNVPIVLCNSTKYGGSGGSVCVLSTEQSANEIAFHEFGHTGGGLADEYWESTTDSWNRSEAPNRTANNNGSTCKWSDLMGVNGVGLYPFAENGVYDWYRPHEDCEMRYLNREFCEVCKRQIRNVVKTTVNSKIEANVVVSNQDQLLEYISKVNNGAATYGKTITLNADINITKAFTPMWNFSGTFNGNGHTISGINYSGGNNTAFIGTLEKSGTINNLSIKSSTFTATGDTWYIGGIVGFNRGHITQCSFDGTINGNSAVGGIAGWNEGSIDNCYSLATISSSQCAGGIVGWMNSGSVNNCYGYGKVTGNYGCAVVGYNPNNASITNYYYNNANNSKGVNNDGAGGYSSGDFSNGTITNKLNAVSNVWKQGGSYPVFSFGSQQVETTTQNKNAFAKIEAENFSKKNALVVDENGARSGGKNLGGVINGSYTEYSDIEFSEDTSSLTIHYASPSGTASGNVEVYVDNLNTRVGSIPLANNGSNWDTYSTLSGRLNTKISAGRHKIYLKFVTTNSAYYVANVDYFSFIKANGDRTPLVGYTTPADSTWTDAGNWGCYFASWAGTSIGCYKLEGNVYKVFFGQTNPVQWLAQIRYNQPATIGHEYRVTASIATDKTCSIGIKEDISNEKDDPVYTTINAGQTGTLTGTYKVTEDNAIRVMFEVGQGVNEGTLLTFNSIKIEDITPVTTTTTKAPETTTTTTNAPETTTQPQKADSEYIKTVGYQISTLNEGFRIVGQVEPTINGKTVSNWGIVYALESHDGINTGVTAAHMTVGSTNKYVTSFESTVIGRLNSQMGDSSTAIYYAQTMEFGNRTKSALTAKYIVRSYVKYSDGTYAYGDVSSLTIYNIADVLYKNNGMGNETAHNYLYDNILHVVDNNYGKIDFNWNNTIVKFTK